MHVFPHLLAPAAWLQECEIKEHPGDTAGTTKEDVDGKSCRENKYALAHTLCRVVGNVVGNLMPKNCGKAVFVSADRQNSRKDKDFPTFKRLSMLNIKRESHHPLTQVSRRHSSQGCR